MITNIKLNKTNYLAVYLSILMMLSQHLIQSSNGQSCGTMLPANSQTILDSNTYHTTDTAGQTHPFDINGWMRIDVDGTTYDPPDRLSWVALLNTGRCGPTYRSCLLGTVNIVDSSQEMNWVVTSYYETEGNVIHIRVKCIALTGTGFATDCRDAFQIFYYESDQSITITNSLLSQFLPADSNKTVSGVVSAEFTKSKKGFYIGFFNNIPCPDLTEFLFYYFECPAINTSDLYSLPGTPIPNPTDQLVQVNISCPTNSLHRDPLRLVAECYWDGTWILPAESVCECEAGYYLSVSNANSSMPCVMCRVDTYKGETGNSEECSVCPFRSSTRGMEGSSECLCDEDWHRGEGESVSESCGQSPSVVVNLRVERGDRNVSRVMWDEPLYLGYRSENELRYNVSYYPSLTPSSESVRDLRETELVLSSGDVEDSTEYVFVVTSWNSVSCLSGVFNRANVTVLTSFPTLLNISYNETTGYLQWSYEPYGKRDYVFQINYTTNVSSISNRIESQELNSDECECSANILCTCILSTPDLDSTHNVAFRLLVNISSNLIGTNLNFFHSFAPSLRSTVAPSFASSTNSTPSPSLTASSISAPAPFNPLIIIGVVGIVIFFLIIIFIILIIGFMIRRRKSVRSKFSHQKFDNTALKGTNHSDPIPEKLYQDPSTMYQDLNEAVRSLTKELNPSNIKIERVIGEGEFGEVCIGTLQVNYRTVQVAIKTLKPDCSEKSKQDFFKEASAMAQFSHENVIYLYGVTLTKPIMIVTPFMENGSLDKFLICNKGNMLVIDLGRICHGVARGMCYLSQIGFVHRDLAARNVLIDTDLTAKIADFGLSRETEEDIYNVKTGGKIPVRWTAPEAILFRKFNMASDVWSFGVLMWEVMTSGDVPYVDKDNFKLLQDIQQGYRLEQPSDCPNQLYQLMLKCWDSVPEVRPTFSELETEISAMVEYNFLPKPRGRPSRSTVQSPLNFTSVDEWLKHLNLERYSVNFKSHGYTMISSVWHMSEHDIMAIDILPAGHRNKLMKSIHEANNKLSRTYSVRV